MSKCFIIKNHVLILLQPIHSNKFIIGIQIKYRKTFKQCVRRHFKNLISYRLRPKGKKTYTTDMCY